MLKNNISTNILICFTQKNNLNIAGIEQLKIIQCTKSEIPNVMHQYDIHYSLYNYFQGFDATLVKLSSPHEACFKVTGMVCASCTSAVEKGLRELKGNTVVALVIKEYTILHHCYHTGVQMCSHHCSHHCYHTYPYRCSDV